MEDEWITSEEIKEVLEANDLNVVGQTDNADEAFVTGTFSGIIPVVEIDGHKFNLGPLTNRLSAIYKEDIEHLS